MTVTVLVCTWSLAVGIGLWMLWDYGHTAGADGSVVRQWPEQTSIERDPRRSTLVMFVHPRCPCSRASVAELERTLAKGSTEVLVVVLFVRPQPHGEDWEKTDLWQAAAKIPGVRVICDVNGAEATRFGAVTSGQTLFYAADGRLLFRGGLTASRGHQGDNAGRRAVVALLTTGTASQTSSPVYGCPLSNTCFESHQAIPGCCQK